MPPRFTTLITAQANTQTDTHVQIHYFLEPTALSPATPSTPSKLLVPASRSINKIGHALAMLDPVFKRYTLEDDRVRDLAKELGEMESPRVLQSMIICKQPRIGGKGECPSIGRLASATSERTGWGWV
jgi:hypothetical protein